MTVARLSVMNPDDFTPSINTYSLKGLKIRICFFLKILCSLIPNTSWFLSVGASVLISRFCGFVVWAVPVARASVAMMATSQQPGRALVTTHLGSRNVTKGRRTGALALGANLKGAQK